MLEGAGLTPITKASPLAKDVLRDCYAAKLAQSELPRLQAVYVQQHDHPGDGPFGKSKSLDEVLEKLEARSGPQARALFERFLREAAKLERSGNSRREA